MSAVYINNGGALLQISGIITDAEVNALGSAPFIFQTPANFMPLGFYLTAYSGNTQPTFTENLCLQTVSDTRILFSGLDPANVDYYSVFGLRLEPPPPGSPTQVGSYNILINLENNLQLTSLIGNDPTPGDYTYKYNLVGLILV